MVQQALSVVQVPGSSRRILFFPNAWLEGVNIEAVSVDRIVYLQDFLRLECC
jgi:hypothetical protein